ncbi:MAG TPA: hypothetical protein DEQ14_02305, partial [Treponema sp.]|nr:hypothetical protein [Treponema sp.]
TEAETGSGDIILTAEESVIVSDSVTTNGAAVKITATDGNITLDGAVNSGSSGNVSLTAGANISGTGIISANVLTAEAGTSITLDGDNQVSEFTTGTATPSGTVSLNNTQDLLISVAEAQGNISIENTGEITLTSIINSTVSSSTGAVSITATGGNIEGMGEIKGNSVTLTTLNTGNINLTGQTTSNAAVDFTAADAITGTGAITAGGVVTLVSAEDSDITINDAIKGLRLVIKVGDPSNSQGNGKVIVSDSITVDNPGAPHEESAAVYIWAKSVERSAGTTTTPGVVELWVDEMPDDFYVSNIVPVPPLDAASVKFHIHPRREVHLVYRN